MSVLGRPLACRRRRVNRPRPVRQNPQSPPICRILHCTSHTNYRTFQLPIKCAFPQRESSLCVSAMIDCAGYAAHDVYAAGYEYCISAVLRFPAKPLSLRHVR